MTVSLGLDIGSNSVGSAWVDTEQQSLVLGVSVFPAGVDETDTKRGSPVNQKRREKRSQRRSLARRAQRKRLLRMALMRAGLLPEDAPQLAELFNLNPWYLRRDALTHALSPHEFGRALVHLNQRRGALGVETDPEDEEEGKVKEAIDHLKTQLNGRKFGQFMADLMDERRRLVAGKSDKYYQDPIRNRRDKFEFHADRPLIRAEFDAIWEKQRSFDGELAKRLTDDLKRELDEAREDDTWRHKGVLFGQRRTYWNTGTLGRCDLEPTDQRCALADMYAQEFRVVETVNNVRIEERGKLARALAPEERANVMGALRKQKTGSVATVRKALGIDKKAVKALFTLNIERDPDREINTDWFYREIVHGVFGEERWLGMESRPRNSVNRAILRFDPETSAHADALCTGAQRWWGLDASAAERLVAAWKARPKLEKRVSLSRRAIQNLLPYMNEFDPVNNRWPTEIEARQRFAEDGSHDAPAEQRRHYALGASALTKADRHYLRKHPDLLPPAPLLANPVVRKAIHEVRRHVIAYLRRFGRKPDRIVIEFARAAKQSGKVRQAALDRNRWREKSRKDIIAQFNLGALSLNQQRTAVERVLLCRQQRYVCAYTGETIAEDRAAQGTDVETDHIVPYSRCGDNSLNNRVLCCRASNRGKGNKTPREWLGERLGELLQRFAHFERYKPQKGEADAYFSPKDYARKWENLTREVREEEEWKNSQLTDTAYAARQVAAYLRDALYGGERSGERRIYVTKGKYTALLRRDWQLFQNLRPRQDRADGAVSEGEGPASTEKERGDHRHHAIDAIAIALTDPRIEPILARQAAEAEEYHERTGHWLQRVALSAPWGAVEEFRRQVLEGSDQLVVSHRAVKRKVAGYLHKEDLWGVVDEDRGVFRIRCGVAELNPKMLRMPVEESDDEVRKRLLGELQHSGVTDKDARTRARAMLEGGHFQRRLVDPSLGKGGLVRDWELRRIIRACLKANEVDPDSFTPKQMAEFAQSGKLRMPRSGVPIKSVITIGPISDPVKIAVRDPVTGQQAVNARTGQALFRYHISRNNHHIEIRENCCTGEWAGDVVSTFEVAGANAARLAALRGAGVPAGSVLRKLPKPERAKFRTTIAQVCAQHPLVRRGDDEGSRFIMSLSEGEVVLARRNDAPADTPGSVGYFVVVKLDKPARIHLAPHWDARTAAEQDRWDVTPADLKDCGPEPGQLPCKVRVGPLGDVTVLERD